MGLGMDDTSVELQYTATSADGGRAESRPFATYSPSAHLCVPLLAVSRVRVEAISTKTAMGVVGADDGPSGGGGGGAGGGAAGLSSRGVQALAATVKTTDCAVHVFVYHGATAADPHYQGAQPGVLVDADGAALQAVAEGAQEHAWVRAPTFPLMHKLPPPPPPVDGWTLFALDREHQRMVNHSPPSHMFAYRLTYVNREYALCSTYPPELMVPASVQDATIVAAGRYRSKHRLPAVVWFCGGVSLSRASQPLSSVLGLRNHADEALLSALRSSPLHGHAPAGWGAAAVAGAARTPAAGGLHSAPSALTLTKSKSDGGGLSSDPAGSSAGAASGEVLLSVFDARPRLNALGNAARGGGTEQIQHYPLCDLAFLGIDNIHVVRDALRALRDYVVASAAVAVNRGPAGARLRAQTAGATPSTPIGAAPPVPPPPPVSQRGVASPPPHRTATSASVDGAAVTAHGGFTADGGGGRFAQSLVDPLHAPTRSSSDVFAVREIDAALEAVLASDMLGTSAVGISLAALTGPGGSALRGGRDSGMLPPSLLEGAVGSLLTPVGLLGVGGGLASLTVPSEEGEEEGDDEGEVVTIVAKGGGAAVEGQPSPGLLDLGGDADGEGVGFVGDATGVDDGEEEGEEEEGGSDAEDRVEAGSRRLFPRAHGAARPGRASHAAGASGVSTVPEGPQRRYSDVLGGRAVDRRSMRAVAALASAAGVLPTADGPPEASGVSPALQSTATAPSARHGSFAAPSSAPLEGSAAMRIVGASRRSFAAPSADAAAGSPLAAPPLPATTVEWGATVSTTHLAASIVGAAPTATAAAAPSPQRKGLLRATTAAIMRLAAAATPSRLRSTAGGRSAPVTARESFSPASSPLTSTATSTLTTFTTTVMSLAEAATTPSRSRPTSIDFRRQPAPAASPATGADGATTVHHATSVTTTSPATSATVPSAAIARARSAATMGFTRAFSSGPAGDTATDPLGGPSDASAHGQPWLKLLSILLTGAVRIARRIDSGVSAFVHCSDGWDRTAALTSLVQLMVDPHYRTLQGMCVLVEKEWCCFGHRFARRNGTGGSGVDRKNAKDDQRAPIFAQWVDAVWQLWRQFPAAFQFNERLLVALEEHAYSGRFGTFLYDNHRERSEARVPETTVSLWTWVLHPGHARAFVNDAYRPSAAAAALLAAQAAGEAGKLTLGSASLYPATRVEALAVWPYWAARWTHAAPDATTPGDAAGYPVAALAPLALEAAAGEEEAATGRRGASDSIASTGSAAVLAGGDP